MVVLYKVFDGQQMGATKKIIVPSRLKGRIYKLPTRLSTNNVDNPDGAELGWQSTLTRDARAFGFVSGGARARPVGDRGQRLQ
jgi:hypothetical protein